MLNVDSASMMYMLVAAVGTESRYSRVLMEGLNASIATGTEEMQVACFDTHFHQPALRPEDVKMVPLPAVASGTIKFSVPIKFGDKRRKHIECPSERPLITQVADSDKIESTVRGTAALFADHLRRMRFLDVSPDAMRRPSFPGQITLGDHGENLSSVLQAICEKPEGKASLLEWLRELTPMDVVDLEFPPDQIGRVLVTLVEEGGRRTSAYSASDGTLRFLGIVAALLGPNRGGLYFFEEIDNGIHPTRLRLLMDLITRTVKKGDVQVIATTHSPQLLLYLNDEMLQYVSVVHRLPGAAGSAVTRLVDIPHAMDVLKRQDIARLHASGWFEDALAFAQPAPAAEKPEPAADKPAEDAPAPTGSEPSLGGTP